MFLYERFYEIWIMQFVFLSRLKLGLCKSSGKLFKSFVCSSSRQVFISKAVFCLYFMRFILMTLFCILFIYLGHLFCIFYTLDENIYYWKPWCIRSCDSRDYFDMFVTSWIICFVLKEIWNKLAILRVCIYFELFSQTRSATIL